METNVIPNSFNQASGIRLLRAAVDPAFNADAFAQYTDERNQAVSELIALTGLAYDYDPDDGLTPEEYKVNILSQYPRFHPSAIVPSDYGWTTVSDLIDACISAAADEDLADANVVMVASDGSSIPSVRASSVIQNLMDQFQSSAALASCLIATGMEEFIDANDKISFLKDGFLRRVSGLVSQPSEAVCSYYIDAIAAGQEQVEILDSVIQDSGVEQLLAEQASYQPLTLGSFDLSNYTGASPLGPLSFDGITEGLATVVKVGANVLSSIGKAIGQGAKKLFGKAADFIDTTFVDPVDYELIVKDSDFNSLSGLFFQEKFDQPRDVRLDLLLSTVGYDPTLYAAAFSKIKENYLTPQEKVISIRTVYGYMEGYGAPTVPSIGLVPFADGTQAYGKAVLNPVQNPIDGSSTPSYMTFVPRAFDYDRFVNYAYQDLSLLQPNIKQALSGYSSIVLYDADAKKPDSYQDSGDPSDFDPGELVPFQGVVGVMRNHPDIFNIDQASESSVAKSLQFDKALHNFILAADETAFTRGQFAAYADSSGQSPSFAVRSPLWFNQDYFENITNEDFIALSSNLPVTADDFIITTDLSATFDLIFRNYMYHKMDSYMSPVSYAYWPYLTSTNYRPIGTMRLKTDAENAEKANNFIVAAIVVTVIAVVAITTGVVLRKIATKRAWKRENILAQAQSKLWNGETLSSSEKRRYKRAVKKGGLSSLFGGASATSDAPALLDYMTGMNDETISVQELITGHPSNPS